MKKLLFILLFLTSVGVYGQSVSTIIPLPKTITAQRGQFALTSKANVYYADAALQPLAALLSSGIRDAAGIHLPLQTGPVKQPKVPSIMLQLDKTVQHDEGYVLDVQPNGITIKASKENGLFYGIQTLLQMIPLDGKKSIPAQLIQDEPRFSWRGMMMDPCRHFWSVDFIKKFIDQLAFHKLNKFHWHLTEDQGWRIEIKKYPRLQEIAAWRNGTQVGTNPKKTDGIRYGGYYTQEQVKEVVAYAATKYVEVIPEIEMPGHNVAAITAYPQLACNPLSFETGKPHEVRQVWGVSKDILCAGNDTVFNFFAPGVSM